MWRITIKIENGVQALWMDETYDTSSSSTGLLVSKSTNEPQLPYDNKPTTYPGYCNQDE